MYERLGALLKDLDAELEAIQAELVEERAKESPKPERVKLLEGQEFMLKEAVESLESTFLTWTEYGMIFERDELAGVEKWN